MPDKHILHGTWRDSFVEVDTKGFEKTQDVEQGQMLGDMLKAHADLLREPAKMMERGRAIAEEALHTINGERQDQYGNPEDTFKQIAVLWEAYLGTKITPPMVADMMCLLKIARERGGKGKRDNAVDLLGYAMLGARIRGYDA